MGIKVSTVEVKNVDIPVEMQRAIARQAEAERERRAKINPCRREFQASQKLSEAAAVIYCSDCTPAQVPPDPDRDRNGKELDHPLPLPIDTIKYFIDSVKSKGDS